MPQRILPIFPDGVTHITPDLAFEKIDDEIVYFHGMLPVFRHAVKDISTFRMIISQFYINGHVKQAQLCRVFSIAKILVKRAVKTYREKGPAGFFISPNIRKPRVLKPAVISEAQELFDAGKSTTEVAKLLNLKRDTLAKAITAGRLKKKIRH